MVNKERFHARTASEVKHYEYASERAQILVFLRGDSPTLFQELRMDTYVDLPGLTPLRSIKNNLIIFLLYSHGLQSMKG